MPVMPLAWCDAIVVFRFPRQLELEFVCFDICTYFCFWQSTSILPSFSSNYIGCYSRIPSLRLGARVTEKPQKSPRHSELRFMIGSHVRDQMLISFFNRSRCQWPRPSMSSWKKNSVTLFFPSLLSRADLPCIVLLLVSVTLTTGFPLACTSCCLYFL